MRLNTKGCLQWAIVLASVFVFMVVLIVVGEVAGALIR